MEKHILYVRFAILIFMSAVQVPMAFAQQGLDIYAFHNDRVADQQITFQFERSTDEQLRRGSPQQARLDNRLKEHYARACANKKSPFKQVLHEFVPETASFNGGLAIAAEMHLHKDPSGLQHFFQQSITDPLAHVSFAFFMLGSRLTTSALTMMGLNFDPCRAGPKNLAITPYVTRAGEVDFDVKMKPNAVQKVARHLVGPLSMTGGFLLSTPIHEFLADPNIQLCSLGLVKKLDPLMMAEREKACDAAYEAWVTTRKIAGYMPDILGMTLTSVIQAYAINAGFQGGQYLARTAAKGPLAAMAMKVGLEGSKTPTNFVLSKILVLTGVIPGGAVIQFGLKAVHAFVFVTLQEFITPYFKYPLQRRLHGNDVTESINEILTELDRHEKNQWVFSPKPRPAHCDSSTTPSDWANGAPLPHTDCIKEQIPPDKLVSKLGDKYRAWRDFVLEGAHLAHSNWKDHLLAFQSSYGNSYAFYKEIVSLVNWKQTRGPDGLADALVDAFYSAAPFSGVSAEVPDKICSMLEDSRERFKRAEAVTRAVIAEEQASVGSATELDRLERILSGLTALDCSVKITEAQNPDEDNLLRKRRFAQGMEALRTAMLLPQFSDYGVSPENPNYLKVVKKNPYGRIRASLGSGGPMAEGRAYLLGVNETASIIDQKSKDLHPAGVGAGLRARTPMMVDYLLGSMICGPEPDASKSPKTALYKEEKKSLWVKTLGFLGNIIPGVDVSNEPNLQDSDSLIFVQYEEEVPGTISQLHGVRAAFRPPKIVEGLPASVCDTYPANANRNLPSWDIHEAKFNINGREHTGFLDLVKNYIRPSIVTGADGKSGFESWWEKAIDPQVVKVIELYREDFKHIINSQFIPNFVRTDTQTYNGRIFELGVARSMMNEADLNLILVGKTLRLGTIVRNPDPKNKSDVMNFALRQRYMELSREFKRRLGLLTDLLGEESTADKAVLEIERLASKVVAPEPKRALLDIHTSRFRKAYDKNRAELMNIHKELAKYTPTTAPALGKPDEKGLSMLAAVNRAALANLAGLVTQTDSFFDIVDTVRMPGMK